MAIYHLTAKVHSRSAGRRAVACAAYRSRDRLTDERTGETWDYRKRGPEESEILVPERAPEWARDREQLWNHAEACEKRKDAQVAREVEVALPKELTPEQQRELVREFARENFVERGVVVDAAYHRSNEENPHAHLLITTRPVGEDGFGKKDREMNSKEALAAWRESWEKDTNRALERAGKEERISHRSLKDQGILDREPAKHEGPHVRAMEERGERTELGEYNRAVREHNSNLIDFQKAKEEIERLRPVAERHQERMKEGYWSQDGSQAIGRLEERQGGAVAREEIERQRAAREVRTERLRLEEKPLDGKFKGLDHRAGMLKHELAEYNRALKQYEHDSSGWERTKARLQLRGSEHDGKLKDEMRGVENHAARYREALGGQTPEQLTDARQRAEQALDAKRSEIAEHSRQGKAWEEAGKAYLEHDRARAERDPEIVRRYSARLESRCYYPREAKDLRGIEGREGREMRAPELRERAAELKQAQRGHGEKAGEFDGRARDLEGAGHKARELHHGLARATQELTERDTLKEKARRFISPAARRERQELEQRQEQAHKGLGELERKHGTTDPRRLEASGKEAWEQSRTERALGEARGDEAQHYDSAARTMGRAEERGRYREMTPEQRKGYDREHPYNHMKSDLREIKREVMKELQPERYEHAQKAMERAMERTRDYTRSR